MTMAAAITPPMPMASGQITRGDRIQLRLRDGLARR